MNFILKFYHVLILINLTQCNSDIDLKNRSKRFFQNFNSYFSKSTEATIEIPKTNGSRLLKPVYVVDAHHLCNGNGYENCSSAEFGKKLESSTPATFLTPPPKNSEQFSRFNDGNDKMHFMRELQNLGYFYTNPPFQGVFSEANGKKSQFHFQQTPYYVDFDSFRISVFDVICIKSLKNGRFSVGLTASKNVPSSPIIENGYTTENPPKCSLTTINSTTFQINILEPDMISCGVYYCNSDTEIDLMCLTLRFPVISGIKTSDDITVRIQCRPQQQLLSHVKQLQLKSSHSQTNTGRSLPFLATVSSGLIQELHTDVGLYSLNNNGFTQLIRNNDVVSLGEDLQLRSVVRQGDGWHYSRFGKIAVHKVTPPSTGYLYEDPESIVVVADDGCVNSVMQSICPQAPFHDPDNPLISILNLKMFMFSSMKDGDELSITVTTFGCVHYEDCFSENYFCQNWPKNRIKRSENRSNNTVDATSEIKLRITTQPVKNKLITCDENSCQEDNFQKFEKKSFTVIIFLICFISLISAILLYYNCAMMFKFRSICSNENK